MKKLFFVILIGLTTLVGNQLIGQNDSIEIHVKAKQDSLRLAEKEAKEKIVKIEKLRIIQSLQEKQLNQQIEEQKKQRRIIYSGILILFASITIAIVLIIRNRKLVKKK